MKPLRCPWEHRFWVKVAKASENECWPWTASLDRKGYGQLNIDGFPRRAHRLAYELAVGPIPDGLCVLHACDNPACCNPAHLFAGTHKANTQDMLAKGRDNHGVLLGDNHPCAKLTEDDVREIRRLRAEGEKLRIISLRFGIAQITVSDIARRKRWKHVV